MSKESAVKRQNLVPVSKDVPTTWTGRGKAFDRLSDQLGRIQDHLDGPEGLEAKLVRASLKDTMIAQAVLVDKLLVLTGQPTTIYSSNEERSSLDDLEKAILAEIRSRGLKAKLTERTAEVNVIGNISPVNGPEPVK